VNRIVEAVIKFKSDFTQFGDVQKGCLAGGVITHSEGDTYIENENYRIGGGQTVTWNGNLVLKNSTLDAQTNGGAVAVINGNIYKCGASSILGNVTRTGALYNFCPAFTPPILSNNYFTYNAVHVFHSPNTAPVVLTFSPGGTYTWSNDTVPPGNGTATLPAAGGILYCQFCDFSRIDRPTTIVALDNGTTGGNLIIDDNIIYDGGSPHSATAGHTFGGLASRYILWQEPGGDVTMDTVGVFYTGMNCTAGFHAPLQVCMGGSFTWPGGNPTCSTVGSSMWTQYGSLTPGFLQFYGGNHIKIYDTGLRANPPPGLPENPYLVNYRVYGTKE
jgi:hypothetical protein